MHDHDMTGLKFLAFEGAEKEQGPTVSDKNGTPVPPRTEISGM